MIEKNCALSPQSLRKICPLFQYASFSFYRRKALSFLFFMYFLGNKALEQIPATTVRCVN